MSRTMRRSQPSSLTLAKGSELALTEVEGQGGWPWQPANVPWSGQYAQGTGSPGSTPSAGSQDQPVDVPEPALP